VTIQVCADIEVICLKTGDRVKTRVTSKAQFAPKLNGAGGRVRTVRRIEQPEVSSVAACLSLRFIGCPEMTGIGG
jgi:hypothetical protein